MLTRRLFTKLYTYRTCTRNFTDVSEGVLISTAHQEKTVILTLKNEGKMNCMTELIASQFQKIVSGLPETHPEALCLVVTGHGGSFAAGADLDWLEERTRTEPSDNVQIMKDYYAHFTPLIDTPVPTIAAINGPAIGAGFCVSMFCDLRVSSVDSKLGANFVKLGINPGMGGTFTLPFNLPHQVANEILLTGRVMSGKEAERLGVVLKCTETRDEVLPAALKLAESIVTCSPIAVKETVKLLRLAQQNLLQSQLDREAEAQARCFAAPDIKIGLSAVRNKTLPKF